MHLTAAHLPTYPLCSATLSNLQKQQDEIQFFVDFTQVFSTYNLHERRKQENSLSYVCGEFLVSKQLHFHGCLRCIRRVNTCTVSSYTFGCYPKFMTDVPRLASPANGYNARNPPNQTERTYADAFYSSTVW